jgi:hypothetical protein
VKVEAAPYQCNVCKKHRADDSNNWYLITVGNPEVIHRPWHGATEEAIREADYHVCGVAHLLQIINRLCDAPKVLEGQ